MALACVVTTIQLPTPSMRSLYSAVEMAGGSLFVIGDVKGPPSFDLGPRCRLYSVESQRDEGFALECLLPTNHYVRKNIGYLMAIRSGAEVLYESDDDNAPLDSWTIRNRDTDAATIRLEGWVNVYEHFTRERIWPRGFPLDAVRSSRKVECDFTEPARVSAPVQQGLANGSPDVDAVWRLTLDKEFEFDDAPSVWLAPGAWCPFNSQSTWWWPEAYPLMYLPSYCTFRMTDIWRSFIAQRCLWELNLGVVFHAPEVRQDRNPHNYLKDFADEIPGYLRNREIVSALEAIQLRAGAASVGANLQTCYEALVSRGVFPSGELALLGAWLGDLESVTASSPQNSR